MRKFNARRRLKAAADAVIMANRMQKMMQSIGLRKKEEGSATAGKILCIILYYTILHNKHYTLTTLYFLYAL
jgi:hypothetical protein